MRLLIADAARSRRGVLRETLAKLGFAPRFVEEAGTAEEALALLGRKTDRIDAVLSDWDLPGGEGKGLLDRVKALPQGVSVSVVYFVYEAKRPEAEEAVRLGARGYLVRPYSDEDLRVRLGTMLERQTARRTRAAKDLLKSIVSTVDPVLDLPFLMQLPSPIMKDLLKFAEKRTWEAGQVVIAAGTPVDAFHLITVGQIELVEPDGRVVAILDTGEPFLEIPFMSEQKADQSARAKTWTQGVVLSRPRLAELVAKQPLMSMHLSGLVARKSRQAQPAGGATSEFQGHLSSMGFAEVMQLLQLGRKTGALTLVQGSKKLGIEMENGEAIHAWTDTHQGEDAFYEIAILDDASFAFNGGPVKGPRSIQQPTMSLLMEAMRRRDEKGRETPKPPGSELDALFGPG
jgi:two-component system chemotaxis response regulator CheY